MNSPADRPPSEFVSLIDRVPWNDASPEDVARLEQYLVEFPDLWPIYLRALHTHHCLRQRFEVSLTVAATTPNDKQRPLRRFRKRFFVALAGGLAAAVVVAAFILFRPGHGSESVAKLMTLQGESSRTVQESFFAGDEFEIRAGLAEVRLATGTLLVIEGPAAIEFHSPSRCGLREGRVSVRSVGPEQFIIETRTTRVTDVRSEFGVEVEGTGATTVQVYSGKVSAGRSSDLKTTQTIPAGESIRFGDAANPLPRAVAFSPTRFVREMPPSETRPGSKDDQKRPYNQPQHTTLRIPWASKPPVPDGDLSDWPTAVGFTSHCAEPYANDYHLKGMATYDADNLYLAAEVGDPYPMRNGFSPATFNHAWSGGGVIVRLGTDAKMGWPVEASDPSRDRVPVGPLDRSDRLFHLLAWYYEPERTSCLEVARGMDYHGKVRNPAGTLSAHKLRPDGSGYTFEYTIPWAVLGGVGLAPRPGDVTPMCWVAHWADPTGRIWRGQLFDIHNPARPGWNFHHAATWGRAVWLGPEESK